MKICPECLSRIDEAETVCPRCGHVLIRNEGEDDELLENDVEDEEEEVEERRLWNFGNTLIALLLFLLIAALGVFLYLNGLKWPYEDAKRYYDEEKAAYEQQYEEYKSLASQLSASNDVLDAKMEALSGVIFSGDEPLDPRTKTNALTILQQARELKVEAPTIEAPTIPEPAKDSVLHAKDIRETAKIIDQQRFSYYQKYSDLEVPDYAPVIDSIERASAALQESIQQKKESEAVSAQLRDLLDRYLEFMEEYIEFMRGYNRSNPEQIEHAEKLQVTYVTYLKQLRAFDVEKMSEADRNYYNAVTESVALRLADANLEEPSEAAP